MIRLTAAFLAVGTLLLASQERRPVALVITGGTVVTMDGARVLAPGAVAIDGREIVAVDTPDGVASRFHAREAIDASADVVLPGLVNAHTHAPMLASGTAPVPATRRAGIPVGIGTDGAASNNDLDMFEAMRQAALLQKLQTGDPRAIPASVALEMATIEGARALGMMREIGSLVAGKRADLIVVSMSSARQTPMYDPISHLVYATRGDDVKTTIVNGRVLMRDRKVLTLNEAAVLQEARALAARVRAAVGR